MILAIDAGNTNIVVGACSDSGVSFFERIKTDKSLTSKSFFELLTQAMSGHPHSFDGAAVCSVAPEITHALADGARMFTGCDPVVVGTDIDTGLSYKLTDISDLGPDLIAGAAAAHDLYTLPAVVVDTGTATTIMAIDENAGFLGGAIVPGIKTSFEALFSKASMMRAFAFDEPSAAIGRNTAEAVSSGAVYGYADMIDGLCRRFARELSSQPKYIITGGLAGRFLKQCSTPFIHDDMLVLKGIYSIYKRNRCTNEH